jgi:hypothetical protein
MKSYFNSFSKHFKIIVVVCSILLNQQLVAQQIQPFKLAPNFIPGQSYDISFSWYSEYDAETEDETSFDDENAAYSPSIQQLLESQIKRPPQSIGKLKLERIENNELTFSYKYTRLEAGKILGAMIGSLSEIPVESKLEAEWNAFLESLRVEFVWNKQNNTLRQLDVVGFEKKVNDALLILKNAANQKIIEPFLEEKKEAIDLAMSREKGFQITVKNYQRESFLHEVYQKDYTQMFLAYAKFITDYAIAEYQAKMVKADLMLLSLFPELAYVFDFAPFQLNPNEINTLTVPFNNSLFLLNAGVHTLEPVMENKNLSLKGTWFLNESQRSTFKERLILYDETLINLLLELRNKPFVASGKEEYAALKLDAKGELEVVWDTDLMIPNKILRKLSGIGLDGEFATYFLFEFLPSKG